MSSKQNKKVVRKYTVRQISQAISDIYEKEGSADSWNVPIVYEKRLINKLKHKLSSLPISNRKRKV